ncbi:MAG: M20/M25/M40 family metallo-hydrolase [Candidatus Thermoplasmatota archaeon]|nr:M20/M25/M40 family metallo-hydrolase [Candidatus Thermoplasmatota archaeon]
MDGGKRLDEVYARIDKNIKGHIARTRRLLKQPSSSQEGLGIVECAELVAKLYEEVGCDKVEVIETNGNPIVYGMCKGTSDKTLLGYFMYDTMPFNEPGWDHPPMEAKIVEKKLPSGKVKAIVNRGADNTKGPLAAFLNSIEACNKSVGRPPVNLILVAEGEEELGSTNLPAYVRNDKKRLSKADACYFPFFGQDSDGASNLYLGVKGVVYFELKSSGKKWGRGPQEFGIHSSHKAWVDSPVWRLVDALGTMSAENGSKILIDGFHDKISPPLEEDGELIKELAKRFDSRAFKSGMKVKKFMLPEDDKEALIKKFLYSTTLNLDGIWGGYMDRGSKTVLPHEVTCKIDIRLVPDQEKKDMIPLVRKHLAAHGYNDIELTEVDTGYDCCRASVMEPVVQSIIRSFKAFDQDPDIWPNSGGAVPFYVFNKFLKLPFTMSGIGHSDLAHSPNEYMVIEGNKKVAGLAEAEKFMVHFMDGFAQS